MTQQKTEVRNILKVERTSDQSVTLGFASCRAASAFEKNIQTKRQEKPAELASLDRLISACERMRDDLLRRAEIDPDGTRAVNVSNSIWEEFNDAMDMAVLEAGTHGNG